MSRAINWGKDNDKRRMRSRGIETLSGDFDTRTQALLRRPPVIRKSKAEMRAELEAAITNTIQKPVAKKFAPARERQVGDKKLADITAEVRGETEKALKLFDGTKTEWVPKSQVEDNGDGTFTMPEWLAKDKGFI